MAAEAILFAAAVPHGPYDVVAMAEEPLTGLLGAGQLEVGVEVAQELVSLHAEGPEAVARLGMAQVEGLADARGIETHHVVATGHLPSGVGGEAAYAE